MKKAIGIILAFFAIAELIALYPLLPDLNNSLFSVAGKSGGDVGSQMHLVGFGIGSIFFLVFTFGAAWCFSSKTHPHGRGLHKKRYKK